jgi:hypothetical protein
MPARQQRLDEVRAEKSRAAEDQDSHERSFPIVMVTAPRRGGFVLADGRFCCMASTRVNLCQPASTAPDAFPSRSHRVARPRCDATAMRCDGAAIAVGSFFQMRVLVAWRQLGLTGVNLCQPRIARRVGETPRGAVSCFAERQKQLHGVAWRCIRLVPSPAVLRGRGIG